MYSLVLMTAMTSAPDGPEFHGFFRDLFRGGCSGSCYGCSGSYAPRYSCYGGCAGTSYAIGCDGGGFGSRVRRLFDRGGCGGCVGSGYGCGAVPVGYSCLGSTAYSCFGGPVASYTPVVNGGLSCHGGLPLSAPPPVFDPLPAVPGSAPPSIPYAPPEAAPGNALNAGLRPVGHTATAPGAGRATVIVRLPVDARLSADGRPLNLTGAERKFVTPELPAGQEFMYRFKAEYERDGETVSVTKKVPVRAGASLSVEFVDLTAKAAPAEKGANTASATPTANPAVPSVAPAATETPAPSAAASDRATITVKLPPGAVLYVDDRKSPSTEPVRKFSTPVLPAGQEFAYLMRAEVVRNGQTETFTQKVPFRAGERVEVDFTGFAR